MNVLCESVCIYYLTDKGLLQEDITTPLMDTEVG